MSQNHYTEVHTLKHIIRCCLSYCSLNDSQGLMQYLIHIANETDVFFNTEFALDLHESFDITLLKMKFQFSTQVFGISKNH